jgi:hypothetical protein
MQHVVQHMQPVGVLCVTCGIVYDCSMWCNSVCNMWCGIMLCMQCCYCLQRKSQKPTDYQVQKQDPEELTNVCKVMEDLIRMQLSLFVVGLSLISLSLSPLFPSLCSSITSPSPFLPHSMQIPAQLYEACLKSLLATDAAAVDMLLKRRCYEQG